jgi:hypothetical protein
LILVSLGFPAINALVCFFIVALSADVLAPYPAKVMLFDLRIIGEIAIGKAITSAQAVADGALTFPAGQAV